jgi:hypothetical protein
VLLLPLPCRRQRFKNSLLLKQQVFKIQAWVNLLLNLCKIKIEIICVQHAPQGTCSAKQSEDAPFAYMTHG